MKFKTWVERFIEEKEFNDMILVVQKNNDIHIVEMDIFIEMIENYSSIEKTDFKKIVIGYDFCNRNRNQFQSLFEQAAEKLL
ncbi:hypothetical protein [Methanolapillus millepedarum]|uniref:Uncharacterized protein n=1 Tax=Methanolapillus millepedarum TaxID=3028296 RepID=A0AA96V317_9EURY|nr:hypothetical protein MsAc7_06950 [Methanosarcinaceae archaeon Ac7]